MGNNYNAIPASVYASWPAINYVNPVRRTWLPAFCVTWQVASTLLLSGRFYLRARKQAGSFGLDDAMIFLGWLFSLVLTAATYLSAESYGLDRHTWDMQPSMYRGVALVSPVLLQAFRLHQSTHDLCRQAGLARSCLSLAPYVPSSRCCYSTAE